MKVILHDIGREHFNGIVDAKSDDDILREVKKHLLSRDVEIEWVGDRGIVLAGFSRVGEVIKGADDETLNRD